MGPLDLLKDMRAHSGSAKTSGLPDDVVSRFVGSHPGLVQAIGEAHAMHMELRSSNLEILQMDEASAVQELQRDYVNFYDEATVNPYVALSARGPWVVTLHGAVLHDSGGYGMLGMGHGPQDVIDTMAKPHVMANVMTANLSHLRMGERLRAEVGQTREDGCPYDRFICMNSGSESVTVAMRIADILAKRMVADGAPHAGQKVKLLALQGAFHGRTDRPAQISDSTLPKYRKFLHSFDARDNLLLARPNDIESLEAAFAQADAEGSYIVAMFFEPVMGEGNPGQLMSRDFYDRARELTHAHGSLLVADSIQAGLRGTGYLSFVDYPGFQDAEPPDMETYSKALNAGQYPLSVLAMNTCAAELYQRGVYGNTMTTNPRALEVACTVLDALTPQVRSNIVDRGREMVDKLRVLQKQFPEIIVEVRGTGLLLCAELDPEVVNVVGFDGMEMWCRKNGIGVIHGGRNALRFTPHFGIASDEIDLLMDMLARGFSEVRAADATTVAPPATRASASA